MKPSIYNFVFDIGSNYLLSKGAIVDDSCSENLCSK